MSNAKTKARPRGLLKPAPAPSQPDKAAPSSARRGRLGVLSPSHANRRGAYKTFAEQRHRHRLRVLSGPD